MILNQVFLCLLVVDFLCGFLVFGDLVLDFLPEAGRSEVVLLEEAEEGGLVSVVGLHGRLGGEALSFELVVDVCLDFELLGLEPEDFLVDVDLVEPDSTFCAPGVIWTTTLSCLSCRVAFSLLVLD